MTRAEAVPGAVVVRVHHSGKRVGEGVYVIQETGPVVGAYVTMRRISDGGLTQGWCYSLRLATADERREVC